MEVPRHIQSFHISNRQPARLSGLNPINISAYIIILIAAQPASSDTKVQFKWLNTAIKGQYKPSS